MKKTITGLLIIYSLFGCSEKIKTIEFSTLKENEFNSKAYQLPPGSVSDSVKHAHDSCMGFSFDANAMLIKAKDSFFIGTILNRQTLQTLSTLKSFSLSPVQLASQFNVITAPCYEKKVLPLPLKYLLGKNFILQLPGSKENVNQELYKAIEASGDAEMQSGSWVYLDIETALKNMIDTAKSNEAMNYRNNVLDTSNMVLTAVQSVTDVSFTINTETDMPETLQTALKSKPSVSTADMRLTMKLSYIDSRRFLLSFNGIFPVLGKFMKAEIRNQVHK